MGRNNITISLTTAVSDDLVAYGAVLRFGQHHKELCACFPICTYLESTVLMEGVINALKAVTRSCEIAVVASNASEIHRGLQVTSLANLRDALTYLDGMHVITWVSLQDHEDVDLCDRLAQEAIVDYRGAMKDMCPGVELIRKTMEIFSIDPHTRISVNRWVGKGEDGSEEWSHPVEISMI